MPQTKSSEAENKATALTKSTEAPAEPKLERPPLPEFTLKNVAGDIVVGVKSLIFDPLALPIIMPCVVVFTSMLCKIIIAKVAYTEIDFSTYMQQIQLVNEGELDYSQIFGDSGPIVYPAGFVQVYQALHWLIGGGDDLAFAQSIFGYLLTFTNLLTCLTYFVAAPNSIAPYFFYFLLLSKRTFSIYVLRLFNDCFTTFAMVGVTIILQQASYWSAYGSFVTFFLSLIAADLFSVAISIKMNALLYLPGFLVVVYFLLAENLLQFVIVLAVIPLIQVLVGWKFLLPFFDDEDAVKIRWNYLNQAFNFLRKFLYEWTVNWRFLSEETFLSDNFAKLLLAGNVLVLVIFTFTRYLSPKIIGKPITKLISDALLKPVFSTASKNNLYLNSTHGPRLVLLTLATSNVIGVLFARSLHFQFLSWYFWQLPFLLFLTGWSIFIVVPVWIVHEYCWNVFPSTPLSSGLLISILSLVLVAVWKNEANWSGATEEEQQKETEKKNQ